MSAPSLNGSIASASRSWWCSSSMAVFGYGGFWWRKGEDGRVLAVWVLGWKGWASKRFQMDKIGFGLKVEVIIFSLGLLLLISQT